MSVLSLTLLAFLCMHSYPDFGLATQDCGMTQAQPPNSKYRQNLIFNSPCPYPRPMTGRVDADWFVLSVGTWSRCEL